MSWTNRLLGVFTNAPPRVRVTDGVVFFSAGGRAEKFCVDALVEVGIVTNDEGPFGDDVFWVLKTEKEARVIPWSAEGGDALLAALQDLPGFDHEAVIAASGSTEPAAFQAWRRGA